MAVKYSQNMTDKDILAGCESVKRRAQSLRSNVECLAVSILFQWGKSGDASAMATKAQRLLESVDGSHQQKIVNWFGAFAGLEYDASEKTFSYTVTKLDPAIWQEARTKEKGVFAFTQDAAPQPYDLPALIKKLIQKSEAKRAKGLGEKDSADLAMIEGLKALVA